MNENSKKSEVLAAFPVIVEVPVQWGDQDAIGHVNNIVPLRWFESARIAYFERLNIDSSGRADGVGFILAANNCDYRLQLTYPDVVTIGARVTKVGNTSMTFETHAFSRSENAIAVEGVSVVVLFDYPNQIKAPISDALRDAVAKLESG